MGLDVQGVVFYGMAVPAKIIRELKERDDLREKWTCSICNKEIKSKFCPEDGGKGEQTTIPPGFRDFKFYTEGDVGTSEVNYNSNNGRYFYYYKAVTDSNRVSISPTPIGKNPANDINFELADCQIKKACEYFQIPYEEPQFYVSMVLDF